MKKRYSPFFNTRRDKPEPKPELGNSVEGIYPSLDQFKSSIEQVDPALRIMDVNMLQKISDDKDRSDQKVREMEGSLGLAMQAIREMDAKIQVMSINKPKLEVKTALIVLMEDNLTKAKRAVMTL